MTLTRPFLVLLVVMSLAPPAVAQGNLDELAEVERRLKDRAEEEKRLRREAEEREQEVAALRRRMIETANSIQESEKRITELENSISELETEKAAAQDALNTESRHLSDVLAALQSLELSRPPALLVSPDDANKAARAAMLLADAAPEVEARAKRLREAISQLTSLTDRLDTERVAFAATNRELSARRDVLGDLMAEKEKERDVAEGLARAAQRETARLAVKATSLRELLQRLERLAHTVTPRIKPPPPQSPPLFAEPATPSIREAPPTPFQAFRSFDEARGVLRPPVAGRLTGRFGKPKPEGGVFEGMRFAARSNAIVTAPFEGRVVVARPWQAVGNIVILDVGDGYHIIFLGVGDVLVQENQRISAGEPLAQMAEGDGELDLEIRKNGEPVNPAFWLSGNDSGGLAL